jgi:hypothetical protein
VSTSTFALLAEVMAHHDEVRALRAVPSPLRINHNALVPSDMQQRAALKFLGVVNLP